VEDGAEEAEAAESPAVDEEAPGGLQSAAADSEAEAADPGSWEAGRAWAALEADQRLTAGYEKIWGIGRKRRNPSAKRPSVLQ